MSRVKEYAIGVLDFDGYFFSFTRKARGKREALENIMKEYAEGALAFDDWEQVSSPIDQVTFHIEEV